MAPEPDEPAPEDRDVKAGKERSRREQSAMDRALDTGCGAARAAAGAVDAAESSAVEATSNASEAVAVDREIAGDRAVAAAAGARAHAAGSCRTATAMAVVHAERFAIGKTRLFLRAEVLFYSDIIMCARMSVYVSRKIIKRSTPNGI